MQKYENREISHVIRSLVYFNDAETEPEIKTTKTLVWQDLKKDFVRWVKDLEV